MQLSGKEGEKVYIFHQGHMNKMSFYPEPLGQCLETWHASSVKLIL